MDRERSLTLADGQGGLDRLASSLVLGTIDRMNARHVAYVIRTVGKEVFVILDGTLLCCCWQCTCRQCDGGSNTASSVSDSVHDRFISLFVSVVSNLHIETAAVRRRLESGYDRRLDGSQPEGKMAQLEISIHALEFALKSRQVNFGVLSESNGMCRFNT